MKGFFEGIFSCVIWFAVGFGGLTFLLYLFDPCGYDFSGECNRRRDLSERAIEQYYDYLERTLDRGGY